MRPHMALCLLALLYNTCLAAHTKKQAYVSSYRSRSRLTRMSVVDFWKLETQGDGLNIRWAHHANSRTALFEHVQDDKNGTKSFLIEGDVFLKLDAPPAPVMTVPYNKSNSLTFQEWLALVSGSEPKKAIKVNFKSTEVVRPALQYLFAAKQSFLSPVILHANIWPSPNSFENPVDGPFFVTQASEHFPDATISVGWTRSSFPHQLTAEQNRYSWRSVFDMLERTYNLHQPVMFSVRASMVDNSFPQLYWLLGLRRSFSLHVWSNANDQITSWTGIVALRKYADPKRIVYDLTPEHTQELKEQYEQLEDEVHVPFDAFSGGSRWQVVKFSSPTQQLSTILLSEQSPAFVGRPSAFLLSERRPSLPQDGQKISGRVLFVPKRDYGDYTHLQENGLSIYLLSSVQDFPGPHIEGGIHIFIGYNGRIFIENREHRITNRRPVDADFLPKAVSQMAKHHCYGFSLIDRNSVVQLNVHLSQCWGTRNIRPPISWQRTLNLNVPPSVRQRHVVVQKSGDATVDVQVQNLKHTNSAAALLRWDSMLALMVTLSLVTYSCRENIY